MWNGTKLSQAVVDRHIQRCKELRNNNTRFELANECIKLGLLHSGNKSDLTHHLAYRRLKAELGLDGKKQAGKGAAQEEPLTAHSSSIAVEFTSENLEYPKMKVAELREL